MSGGFSRCEECSSSFFGENAQEMLRLHDCAATRRWQEHNSHHLMIGAWSMTPEELMAACPTCREAAK